MANVKLETCLKFPYRLKNVISASVQPNLLIVSMVYGTCPKNATFFHSTYTTTYPKILITFFSHITYLLPIFVVR